MAGEIHRIVYKKQVAIYNVCASLCLPTLHNPPFVHRGSVMRFVAVFAVTALLSLLPAQAFAAGPQSLIYPTRTDLWNNDVHRMAALADALSGVSSSFAYHLFDIEPANCKLVGGCDFVAQNYALKASGIARELSDQLRMLDGVGQPTRDNTVAVLRTSHLDQLATLQWGLRKRIMDEHTLGGDLANYECKDFFELYYMLMNRMVAFPRPAGLGGGAGVDD